MKALLKYLICLFISIVILFIYGITIGGHPAKWLLLVVFSLCFLAFAVFERKSKTPTLKKAFNALLCSLIAVFVATLLYYGVNQLGKDYINQYKTTVTDISSSRDITTVYFEDLNGNEQSINLEDVEIILDDDDELQTGDKILINEYYGLFKIKYLTLTETQ